MNFFKKYKTFMSDMVLNMIGFGIYIIAQQILLLPILAKTVNDEIYSMIVLYISILNVVCNVTGGELGNVRLIRDSDYKEKKVDGDFSRILLAISPIITVVVFPILVYLEYSIMGSIILILTILLANIRLYATCYYRLEQKYKKVIIQNVFYFLGIVISLMVFNYTKNIYGLLLLPELVSVFYALKNSDLLKMRFVKTSEMSRTVKKFSQLGVVSLLTNLMNYFDKFFIYPMFGATSVAVYYAVNSMSKIASLVTNPMSSVILSWVSNKNSEKNQNKIIKMTILANLPILLAVTLITIPLTYISLRILYSQYMSAAIVLIFPIAITTAFTIASSLIKSVLLKVCNTNKLVIVYIFYFISFILLGIFMSKKYNLIGFAYANLISRIILWIAFVILLFLSKNRVEDIEIEKSEDK